MDYGYGGVEEEEGGVEEGGVGEVWVRGLYEGYGEGEKCVFDCAVGMFRVPKTLLFLSGGYFLLLQIGSGVNCGALCLYYILVQHP